MEKHILDSVLPMQIPGALPDAGKAIDVGSGAGLPGLMLALFLPRVEWTLMDAQRKRCNFLNLCVEELGAGAGAAQILGGKETAVYKVPYLNDRYLIRYDKTEPTAEKYPRRNGIPNKHPLAEE